MPESIELTIIIISWNTRAYLERCLDSLADCSAPLKIIVVDNASSDGSGALVKARFPGVNLICNDTNRGFAAAVNQGISRTSGGAILLLNPDCVVKPGSIEYCLNKLKTDRQIGIIGCLLRNVDGSIQGSVRHFPGLVDQALILLKLHRVFPNLTALRRYFMSDFDYGAEQRVDQVKGAFFMVARDVIDRIGLFDERFWIWFEEVDYCYRAKQAGFAVMFTPVVEIVHASGESFQSVWTVKRQKLFTSSLVKYFNKYHKGWRAYLIRACVPISYVIALLATPLFIFRKKYLLPNG